MAMIVDLERGSQVPAFVGRTLEQDAAAEDAVCIQEGFPQEIVQAFRQKNISLWRLPEISLLDKPDNDYIDFLRTPHMPERPGEGGERCSAARFKDIRGRVGLALRLRGHADGEVETMGGGSCPIRDISGLISVFQRYVGENSLRLSGPFVKPMVDAYAAAHAPHHVGPYALTCPTCPITPDNPPEIRDFVVRIVSGTDAVFELTSEIAMVDNRQPLPPLVVKPDPRPPESNASDDQSTLSWLWSSVCSAFSDLIAWICSFF
ncbi:MAG: hypothetical protein HYX48_00965 [Chlamydiales bacterium]|nr:hypothetical protein [Chlamydiales bacterium]